MARRIAIMGDLHAGSPHSALPEEFETEEGITILASPAQRSLLASLRDFTEKAADCDTLILLGDLCEGNNRKEFSRKLVTADFEYQVEMALRMLRPIAEGKKVYGVTGSKYHQGLETSLDRTIYRKLGGTYKGKLGRLRLEGTKNGTHIVFVHGSGAPYQYPGTYLNKESFFLDTGESRGRIQPHVNFWCCGHWHIQYRFVDDDSDRKMALVGCWKAWFPYEPMTKFYGIKHPVIGGIILNVDDDGRTSVESYKYPCPLIEDRVEWG